MTVLRTSQVVAEVLRLPTAPALRTSALAVEVLRTNGTESEATQTPMERMLSMRMVFGGEPFIAISTGPATEGLDVAFKGQPFVALADEESGALDGVASSSGSASVDGVGAAAVEAVAQASGSASVLGDATGLVPAVGESAGVAAVDGQGAAATVADAVAESSGASTAEAVGGSALAAEASASGTSSASAIARVALEAVGNAAGTSTVNGLTKQKKGPGRDNASLIWIGVPNNVDLYTNLDEAVGDDSDYCYSTPDGAVATLNIGLQSGLRPGSQYATHTLAFRTAKHNDGVIDGTGNDAELTVSLLNGSNSSVIASRTFTMTGEWVDHDIILSNTQIDQILDYGNLQVEFVAQTNTGSPSNRRGSAVSWVQMEYGALPPPVATNAVGAAAGSATTEAAGASSAPAQGDASGAGTTTGGGLGGWLGDGQASGSSAVDATGASSAAGVGQSSGQAVDTSVGAAQAAAVAASAGSSDVLAASMLLASGAAESAGMAAVQAVGRGIIAITGSSRFVVEVPRDHLVGAVSVEHCSMSLPMAACAVVMVPAESREMGLVCDPPPVGFVAVSAMAQAAGAATGDAAGAMIISAVAQSAGTSSAEAVGATEAASSTYWLATDYAYSATPDEHEPAFYDQPVLIHLRQANELLTAGWDMSSGFSYEWIRRSVVDFSEIGRVTALNDTEAPGGAVDGRDGYLYIMGYFGPTQRLNQTTFAVTSHTQSSVAVPSAYQAVMGMTTILTNGYYFPFINPFNNDIWALDNDTYNAIQIIDKASPTLQPKQTLYLVEPAVNFTSPFSGQVDVNPYYTGRYIQASTRTVFVSATEAYTHDFHTSNIFKIDTTTGAVTYQFQLAAPSGAGSAKFVPLGYHAATNTLWFTPYYGTSAEQKLLAWVVGSHPSTIQEYPFEFDPSIPAAGTAGSQTNWDASQTYYTVDAASEGAWIGLQYYISGSYETPPVMRYFSFIEREFTSLIYDGVTPSATREVPFGFQGYPFEIVNSTTMWAFVMAGRTAGGSNIGKGIKMTLVGERPERSTARYVRLSIDVPVARTWNSSATALPASIQEIAVHSESGGANVAVSATASSSDASFPVSNVLDGNVTASANRWKAANNTFPQWVVLDLGSQVPINDVQIWPANVQTANEGRLSAPANFAIEVSTDGVTWTPKRYYHGVQAWPIGTTPGTDSSSPRSFDAY